MNEVLFSNSLSAINLLMDCLICYPFYTQLQAIKTRTIPFDSKFYTGYRRNTIAPDEVLVSITIPCTSEKEQFIAFKQVSRIFLFNMFMSHSYKCKT